MHVAPGAEVSALVSTCFLQERGRVGVVQAGCCGCDGCGLTLHFASYPNGSAPLTHLPYTLKCLQCRFLPRPAPNISHGPGDTQRKIFYVESIPVGCVDNAAWLSAARLAWGPPCRAMPIPRAVSEGQKTERKQGVPEVRPFVHWTTQC